jgi:hypothetical protein
MESFDELLAVLNHLATSPNSLEGAGYAIKAGHASHDVNIPLYRCLLCYKPGYNSGPDYYHGTFMIHLTEHAHLLRVHQFKLSLNRNISMLRKFDNCRKQGMLERLANLGRTIWTDALHASLFHHITLKPGHDYSLPVATGLLTRYEYLEPQALLALAVWKAECIKQMPLEGIDCFRAQHWISAGWKALKKEHCDSNAMSIVVLSVRPFLDPLGDDKRSGK